VFTLLGLNAGLRPSNIIIFLLAAPLLDPNGGTGLPVITADVIPTELRADQSSVADSTPALTSASANWRARGAAAAAAGDSWANIATTTQHASLTCSKQMFGTTTAHIPGHTCTNLNADVALHWSFQR
jgi:hypothetical protein